MKKRDLHCELKAAAVGIVLITMEVVKQTVMMGENRKIGHKRRIVEQHVPLLAFSSAL